MKQEYNVSISFFWDSDHHKAMVKAAKEDGTITLSSWIRRACVQQLKKQGEK